MPQTLFELDRQTLADLAIFPQASGDYSILGLFDYCVTYGGKDKLDDFFRNPLTDAEAINERLEAIKYIRNNNFDIKLERGPCDFIEFYLKQYNKPTIVSKIRAIEKKLLYFFTGDNNYYIISRGIAYIIELLNQLLAFTQSVDFNNLPELLKQGCLTINDTLQQADFAAICRLARKKSLNGIAIAKADHLFRYTGYERLRVILDVVYQFDVCTTVAYRSKTLGFSFPVFNNSPGPMLNFEGLFHPFIKNPVANPISFNPHKNICFVTGANMAGKSTFLKSIGIAVFLAHLGFPVPADEMEATIFDGLISTINLADNLQHGNSHFYTEVARVKHAAEKMAESPNKVVIFDELFRGTNVKDAFDASLAVISAFAKLNRGIFIISTHIVEVAHELSAIENISFNYMETTFNNNKPTYSYKLMDGITEERLGMWIVKNEGIVELIEGIKKRY